MPITHIPIPGWARARTPQEDLAWKLDLAVAELDLPERVVELLEENLQVLWVNDQLHHSKEDLLKIRGFSSETLESVYHALEGIGFYREGVAPRAFSSSTRPGHFRY